MTRKVLMDFKTKFGRYVHFEGTTNGGRQAQARCPFHDDKVASMSVEIETGLWKCFACGQEGNWTTFLKRIDPGNEELKENIKVKPQVEPLKEILIKDLNTQLLISGQPLKFVMIKRGISKDVVEKYMLGYDGRRVCIPIKDFKGRYINIRRYMPGNSGPKVVNWKEGYGKCFIFPAEHPKGDDVYIMEGEMDCLLARSYGLEAYTQTAGAETWKDDFNYLFAKKNIHIVYDNDDAGREGAIKVSHALLPIAAGVKIVKLPVKNEKEDFTDYICEYKHSIDDFLKLCKSTNDLKSRPEKKDEKPIDIDLFSFSKSSNYEKLVRIHVLVIGKDTSPYIVPKKILLTCNGAGEKKCKRCPILISGSQYEVEFGPQDRDILSMIDTTLTGLGVVAKCKAGVICKGIVSVKIIDTMNVEALTAINDVEYVVEKTDYTVVNLFYTGHGIRTNTTYEMIGRVYPLPRSQHATILVHDAKPAKSSIEAFEINDNIKEMLKAFQVTR